MLYLLIALTISGQRYIKYILDIEIGEIQNKDNFIRVIVFLQISAKTLTGYLHMYVCI